jgi:hypothetical protein
MTVNLRAETATSIDCQWNQQSTVMGWILQTNSAEGINGALGTQPTCGCGARTTPPDQGCLTWCRIILVCLFGTP